MNYAENKKYNNSKSPVSYVSERRRSAETPAAWPEVRAPKLIIWWLYQDMHKQGHVTLTMGFITLQNVGFFN